MAIYFVDYENVSQQGLEITENPTKMIDGDVNIFYTDKCQSINMDIIHNITSLQGKVNLFHVKNGIKNALDFQLSTYLGYVISETEKGDEYIIISKDTGFDRVVWFWETKNVKINRYQSISEYLTGKDIKHILKLEDDYLNLKDLPRSALAKPIEHSLTRETRLVSELQFHRYQADDFKGTKLKKEYATIVADICTTYQNKNDIHNALFNQFGKEGRMIYQQIKKILNQYT